MDLLQRLVELVAQIHDSLDLPSRLREAMLASQESIVVSFQNLVLVTKDPLYGGSFTSLPTIRSFEWAVQAIADTALVGVALWSGYRIMWAHGLHNRHTLRILLPRLLLAVVLVNFALPLLQLVIDANNVLCDSVTRATWAQVWSAVLADLRLDPGLPGLSVLTTGALFAGYLVLALAYVVRFALLVLLAILSPLAALFFVLQETQHYAREWAALFVSSLLMQPLQLLILAVGFGLDASGHWPIRHAFALAALFISFKVPGSLHSAASAGTHAASFANRQAADRARLIEKAAV